MSFMHPNGHVLQTLRNNAMKTVTWLLVLYMETNKIVCGYSILYVVTRFSLFKI